MSERSERALRKANSSHYQTNISFRTFFARRRFPIFMFVQVACVLLATTLSFVCFGLRDQNSTAIVPLLKSMPPFIVFLWGVIFTCQGIMVTRLNAVEEDRVELGLLAISSTKIWVKKAKKKMDEKKKLNVDDCINVCKTPLAKTSSARLLTKTMSNVSAKVIKAIQAKEEFKISPFYRILLMICM